MENMKFEEAMKRLGDIAESLERENVTLDESLSLFEEGVALVRFCNKSLEEAEQRVKILVEGANVIEEKDFSDNDAK